MRKSSNSPSRPSSQRQTTPGGVKRQRKTISTYPMLYGTAWKGPKTQALVTQALSLGFRGIDVAGQPKHYNEKGAGDGIADAINQKLVTREDLFIQTKFSPINAQNPADINPPDPSKANPYHIDDPIEVQVSKSLANSLKNLQTDYLDSWVLHGPLDTYADTLRAWRAMESHVDSNEVDRLGISNCYSLPYLQQLYQDAKHKPEVVQNRFYQDSKWDVSLRQWCREKGITYQSFWTLTANPALLRSAPLKAVAAAHKISPESCLYRYLIHQGCQPLNGSTSVDHIVDDLKFTAPTLPPFSSTELASIGALIRDKFDQ